MIVSLFKAMDEALLVQQAMNGGPSGPGTGINEQAGAMSGQFPPIAGQMGAQRPGSTFPGMTGSQMGGIPGMPGMPGSQMAGMPGMPGSQMTGMPGMSGMPGSQMAGMSGMPGMPGFQMAGMPGMPGSQMAGMSGMPGMPGSQMAGMSGMPGMPGSQMAGMSGMPGMPGSQMGGMAGMPGMPGSQMGGMAGMPGMPGSQMAGMPGMPGSQVGGMAGIPGMEFLGGGGQPQMQNFEQRFNSGQSPGAQWNQPNSLAFGPQPTQFGGIADAQMQGGPFGAGAMGPGFIDPTTGLQTSVTGENSNLFSSGLGSAGSSRGSLPFPGFPSSPGAMNTQSSVAEVTSIQEDMFGYFYLFHTDPSGAGIRVNITKGGYCDRPQAVGQPMCINMCFSDDQCPRNLKCCPNSCALECAEPLMGDQGGSVLTSGVAPVNGR